MSNKKDFLKSWITNPRGQDDSYKREKKKLRKEGDGGGATSGSFGDGGGTVFTSTNAGVFTPTHGDSKGKQKAKRKTGIDKLADFISDNSPERKMQKSEVDIVNLIDWVRLELRKDDERKVEKAFRQSVSSTAINDQTRNPVEFDASPDEQADVEQKDMERKIKALDDNEDSKGGKPQNTGTASQAAPAGLDIRLRWESGSPQDDLGTGGDKDQEQGEIEELEEETEETPFQKLLGKELHDRLVD